MGKRIRKPPIKPEQRREWLKRNEENGESPPQIAGNNFDVRTVRKQIELAKQERENREARSLVLRNAIEQHYYDLRKYAERLNSQISGKDMTPPSPDEEFVAAALREHLPRSPIWDYLRKKQNLEKTEKEQLANNRNMIEQLVKDDQRLNLFSGIVEALVFQAQQWSHEKEGLNPKDNLAIEPAGKGFVNLCYGFAQLGRVDVEHAHEYQETLREVLVKLESQLRDNEQYQELEKTATELERLNRKLRGELAVIRLRRIVPGRCKFCPL